MERKVIVVAATSVVLAVLVVTAVTAYLPCSTPLYTVRMEQVSHKMGFLPTAMNQFTYTAEHGYTLHWDVVEYCGADLFASVKFCTIPITCHWTCENTCDDPTCPLTCPATCWRTCDTCEGQGYTCDDTSCQETCYTCSGLTCELTCYTCEPDPLKTCPIGACETSNCQGP